MLDLRTFLSSLIADSAKGQAQADHIAAEIAGLYRDHDLLKYFSIPKMSISSIDFECNLAITGYQDELQIPPEAGAKFRSDISTYINHEVFDIPETISIINDGKISGTAVEKLRKSYRISEAAHKILDNVGEDYFRTDEFQQNMIPALSEEITGQLANSLKIALPQQQSRCREVASVVKGKLQQYTREWWDNYLKLNPQLVKHKIPLIAVQNNEIADLPPEKMTKATIHMEIKPYEWTSIEMEDENRQKTVKYKLVPE